MKRMTRAIRTSVFVSLLLWPAVGRAGLVVDQPPFPFGGPAADTDFLDAFGGRLSNLEADNILLDNPATVRRATWWGFYGSSGQTHNPPAGSETMRIRFYGARPGDGLPDDSNIIFEESFLNPSRSATGQIVDADVTAPEFIYQTNLSSDVFLQANTPYWLEIVQVGDVDSHFRWESGFGLLNGHAFVNPTVPDWQFTSGSLAFQLSTIPEPTSAALWLIAAITLFSRGGENVMNRAIRTGVFVSLLLWPAAGLGSLVDSTRGTGVIVDRPPLNTGGLGADTLAELFGLPYWERTADHILLSVDQTVEPIRRINWWGFYNENNPPATETMRIRFYGARPGDGLPDDNNIVFEESFLNPTRTATGRVVFVGVDPDEFMFQVDLSTPLSLTPDTPYWFEVAQIGDIDTLFRWEFSTAIPIMGLALINKNTIDWELTPIDVHNAFQLSTVPEPGSAALWVIAVITLFSRGGRKS